MRIVTFLADVFRLQFTSQDSLVLVTLVHTLSDVLDGFLLRLLGASLWPCPGCADSRCASCAPPDRVLFDHLVLLRFSRCLVLSVASCNVADSTTAWSAETFNIIGLVVDCGKTSCVPSLFLFPALLRAVRSSAECHETSLYRLRCIDFC